MGETPRAPERALVRPDRAEPELGLDALEPPIAEEEEPSDGPEILSEEELDAMGACEVGDDVLGTTLVELLATAYGIECWRAERAEGTAASVHVLEPGADAVERELFLAKAVDMQQLGPIAGVLEVTAVDPLTGAYVGVANPIGTVGELTELPWTLEGKLECLRQLGEALSGLHEAGLVHGNLCPNNVLLDAELRPLVANAQAVDLADAWRAAEGLELPPDPYAAPEVRAGQPAAARSDVFSLGQVMHHLLLDHEPEDLDEELPRLESLAEAPSGLRRIIRRCTVRDPAERYANATELVAELDRYVQGETVGLGHPEVVEAYDPVRHAALLREQAGQVHQPTSPAVRWRDPRTPSTPPPPQPAPVARAAASRIRRLWPLLATGLGLLGIAGALALAYHDEGSPRAVALFVMGSLLCSQALPGFGPRPALTRFAAALAAVALIVLLDPVGRVAAYGAQSSGLRATAVSERVATLLEEKAAGRSEFARVDLSGADLSGKDLSGLILDGSSLEGARCVDTSFHNASLLNVNLRAAELSGADLSGVNATQLQGWTDAVCADTTTMPVGWVCEQGHPLREESPQ